MRKLAFLLLLVIAMSFAAMATADNPTCDYPGRRTPEPPRQSCGTYGQEACEGISGAPANENAELAFLQVKDIHGCPQ